MGDRLQIVSPAGHLQFYPLPPGVTNLGQHPANQLVLPGEAVAPFHAVLDHRAHPPQLIPLAPLHVNGQLAPAGEALPLENGATVQIGSTTVIVFSQPAESFTQAPPEASGAEASPGPQPRSESYRGGGKRPQLGSNDVTNRRMPRPAAQRPRFPAGPDEARSSPRGRSGKHNSRGAGPWRTLALSILWQSAAVITLLSLISLSLRLGPYFMPAPAAPMTLSEAAPATRFTTGAPYRAPNLGPTRSQPGQAPPLAAPTTYEDMFRAAAAQYDLDWRLVAAVAYHESRLNPTALGRDNDMGLMQIIPSTWSRFAPQVGVTDPFDPYSNIQVGAAYLAHVRDHCHRRGQYDDYWMVIGYNWGPNNLNRIFNQNGGWADVPAKQRSYALRILQTASSPATLPDTLAAID